MNRTFFRYIARGFWGPFVFGLGVFVALLLFGTLFDKMNFFMKTSSDLGTFLAYLLYQVPHFSVKMMPIATLLAVLFALSGMMASGEWKAGMAGGWKPFDMVLPLLVCSAGTALLQFGLQETVAPSFFMRSEYLFEGKMWGRADWKRLVRRDISFMEPPDVFVTARSFDGNDGSMERVLVDSYSGGRMDTEINAARAEWDGGARSWRFLDGVFIRYGPGGRPHAAFFKARSGGLSSPPDAIVLERLVPEGVTIADIAGRIRRLEAVGAPVVDEKVQLYAKFAGPLANIVLAVAGLTLVLLVRMNRIFGFGVALATGFAFWMFMIMGQYAGEAELIPPSVAGFGPALVFLAGSFIGMRRARVF
ncbi:MAG TPA: LptF/LptG family permease [Elusimicrobiales bacterium]|nr:LptF/LptG family permease [Elusimicrobiales bacterium]